MVRIRVSIMSTILLLDDDPGDRATIQRAVSDADQRLVQAKNLDDFLRRMREDHVELAIISLDIVSDKTMPDIQNAFLRTPETKILALAPIHGGDGLNTLLKAESLHAHHLLAKPVDHEQLLTVLHVMFPVSAPQD